MTITAATFPNPCSRKPSVTEQILKNDYIQVGACAAGSAVALGTAGGVAGLTGGAASGAAVGVVSAFFTFGLSIPIGTIIGGCIGVCAGASAGSAAGALGGMAFGLRKIRRNGLMQLEKEGEQIEVAGSTTPSEGCVVKNFVCDGKHDSYGDLAPFLTTHDDCERVLVAESTASSLGLLSSKLECISEGDEEHEEDEKEHEVDQEKDHEEEGEQKHAEEWEEDEDCDSCRATVSSASEYTCMPDDADAAGKQECRLSVMCSMTNVGDVLAVVGQDEVLGGWDVSKALKLVTSAAEYPRWSAGFSLSEANSEFKLLIVHSNGSISWEPIKRNRVWPSDARTVSARYGKFGNSERETRSSEVQK